MLRWHSSLYAFQLSKRKSVIWAEGPWENPECHPPCPRGYHTRQGGGPGSGMAVGKRRLMCHAVPRRAVPRPGVAMGAGAEQSPILPVLTWQQSSSSRRLRRRGRDIPLLYHGPHGEQRGVSGFLLSLGSSSALAVKVLARR